MSHAPVVVCLAPVEPDGVESAVEEALAPFALVVDEQWFERPHWRDELAEPVDGAGPDAIAAVLAESTGNDWRHEESPTGPRYFELTEDNPRGQWSSYTIGGGYRGLFPVRALADPRNEALVRGECCPDGWADGGPISLLDLGAARRQAQRTAADRYMRWCEITAGNPGVRPLADFEAEHGSPAERWMPSAAAAAFEAQPQVALARAERLVGTGEDPVALFAAPDRLFEEAGLRAVTGAALLTVDGTWCDDPDGAHRPAPRSEESLAYHRRANSYLGSLDADCLIVLTDLYR
ncbi:hypothetical protein [Streptacidiphilus jiangxiensis]|uniref:Uncharacterized protein n=1 Tax=Streptacidiphilus jiangxiensis TaxID=235985 RepID=A0A1H8BA97_STRJI|nr:hypothetical protein [Streptacidiphilus jiangxiensis]SEM79850.1 hypothetical protein SAMN05414137_16011 [Streptacidiphilus jiangxiensis]